MARTKQTVRQSTQPTDMKKMTVKALKALCKERGIKGYSKMKKAALIALLDTLKTPEKKIIKITPQAPKKEKTNEEKTNEEEAPLPFNLDTDEDGFEDFIKNKPEPKPEVNKSYVEYKKVSPKPEVNKSYVEYKKVSPKPSKKVIMAEVDKEIKNRMKKELVEKLEQEKQTQDLLSQIDTETLIRELKKRGFVARKYVKIDKKKINILKASCADMDMLSDDEDDE